MTKVLVVLGTRPEKLKMQPVLDALEERDVETEVFFTNQSPDLVGEIDADYVMDGRWAGLSDGIERVMYELKYRLMDEDVDAVLVQGDTASAFAGALAAFLADVPVGHVEAGLRTYRRTPWPEEAFRGMIARMVRWHFCPDEDSMGNIQCELGNWRRVYHKGAPKEWPLVAVTGNPIIDTLPSQPFRVLVTLHRRENWGETIEDALNELWYFAGNDNVEVTVIRHPNWENHLGEGFLEAVERRCRIGEPTDHRTFSALMQSSDLVVTDSGGLQEEAAHFGVDCIVYREATERTSLEDAGAVQVVDPSEPDSLRSALREAYQKRFCYGDGSAGEQIADILVRELSERREPTERMKELANDN